MPTYTAPTDDYKFLLHQVFNLQNQANVPGFEEATPDLIDAILDEGGKFLSEVIAPLNQVGDREGCVWKDGEVTTPPGFKQAYDQYCESGWNGLTADPEYGGQGLPHVLGTVFSEMISSANLSFGMYPGLTHGAYEAIVRHGSEEQKKLYLPKMVSGEWTGTMNLTEPHCGTDLGLMRTKAEPQEDGTYRITGTKIFISAGEHDMSRNIIHLVLAKIPGGPEGIKGVSLFIVPKFLVNEDGSLGDRNAVSCGSIEEKMGIHGNSTCVMNYDGAVGYLVGQKHKGMRAMFTMMNAARLGVGIQGLSQAEVAYQNAAVYARERLQGRSISGAKNPDLPADPIIVHPDVRRMLLTIRSFTEGARALATWIGIQIDLAEKHPDPQVRKECEDLVALVTPVVKGFLTDAGFESTVMAMQVLGGHGYIREHGMEQFVRDARITQIYEGANGIQALDLVGRKLPQGFGRLLRRFFHPLLDFIQENMSDPAMKDFIMPLAKGTAKLQQATAHLAEAGMKNPDEMGAASAEYLRMFGIVTLGYMWARMAKVANERLAEGAEPRSYYENKLLVGRFYMQRWMPDVSSLFVKMAAGGKVMMSMDQDAF